MSLISNKRSVMTLFNDGLDPYCHRVRIVLAEKGVVSELFEVDQKNVPEELLDLNPYGTVPTLVDRDLVLYQSSVILEYLEERFPHPPLLPVYPVARGRTRLMMYRVDHDWYSLMNIILKNENKSVVDKARTELLDSLMSVSPIFDDSPYFLSDEFTLVDCALAALLWRLPLLGIEIPPQGKSVKKYAERLFNRESFQASLTPEERAIHEKED
jgi:RNA polymerase-associated protein